MMLGRRLLLHWRASQKVVLFLLFFAIVWPLRIRVFHLQTLLIGKLRQMPDKQDELPTIIFGAVATAKRGHARKANAILDDPKQVRRPKDFAFPAFGDRAASDTDPCRTSCRHCRRSRGTTSSDRQNAGALLSDCGPKLASDCACCARPTESTNDAHAARKTPPAPWASRARSGHRARSMAPAAIATPRQQHQHDQNDVSAFHISSYGS